MVSLPTLQAEVLTAVAGAAGRRKVPPTSAATAEAVLTGGRLSPTRCISEQEGAKGEDLVCDGMGFGLGSSGSQMAPFSSERVCPRACEASAKAARAAGNTL